MATSRSEPSPQELAAIVAAVELAWPSSPAPVLEEPTRRTSGWRFSGRWWHPANAGGRPPTSFRSE